MKIDREKPEFKPVCITIETQDELDLFVSILNPGNLDWSDLEDGFSHQLRKGLGAV